MRKIILLAFAFFITTSVRSQSIDKTENIKELLELTGGGKIGAQVAQSVISSLKKNAFYKNIPEEFWENFSKKINPEDIAKMVLPIYEKYYTNDDLVELIKFYKSAVGKKVIATMPQVMAESMDVGRAWGQEIAKKAADEVAAEGYKTK